jgi:hypothetical protein
MPKKRWDELSGAQMGAIAFSGAVQLGLLAAALVDIYRRPAGRSGAESDCGPRRRSSTTSARSPTSCSDGSGRNAPPSGRMIDP